MTPRLASALAAASRSACVKLAESEVATSIREHATIIADVIERYNVKLVVIDPIEHMMGDVANSWNYQQARRALGPIADLARATNVAIASISAAAGAPNRRIDARSMGLDA